MPRFVEGNTHTEQIVNELPAIEGIGSMAIQAWEAMKQGHMELDLQGIRVKASKANAHSVDYEKQAKDALWRLVVQGKGLAYKVLFQESSARFFRGLKPRTMLSVAMISASGKTTWVGVVSKEGEFSTSLDLLGKAKYTPVSRQQVQAAGEPVQNEVDRVATWVPDGKGGYAKQMLSKDERAELGARLKAMAAA